MRSEAEKQICVRVALEPCDFDMDLFDPEFFEEDSGDQKKSFLKNYFLDTIGI